MSHRRLLWPTLMTLAGVVLLVVLGTWQVERMRWKQGLIAARAAALAAEPIALPHDLSAPEALEFRRVVVRGSYLHDQELYLLNRTYKTQVGVHVITPLQRDPIDGGGAVLVNRGWVALARRDPATREAGQTAGNVEVTGIVRVGVTGRNDLTPANDPARGMWYAPDPLAMSQAARLAGFNLIVEAGVGKNGGPGGGQTTTALANNHLSYALTWYGLAVALLAVYLIYLLRRPAAGPSA